MAISARRKHLVNRMMALIDNIKKMPEDFTVDKRFGRLIDKFDSSYKSFQNREAYRQVRRDAAKNRDVAEKKAAEKVVQEAESEAEAPETETKGGK